MRAVRIEYYMTKVTSILHDICYCMSGRAILIGFLRLLGKRSFHLNMFYDRMCVFRPCRQYSFRPRESIYLLLTTAQTVTVDFTKL